MKWNALAATPRTGTTRAMTSGFEKGGYAGAMRSGADTLAALWQQAYFAPTMIAQLYAGAGDAEKALEWVEKGYEIGDPNMPYMGGDGSLQRLLRGDPRFQELLRKMKLPPIEKK